MPGQEPRAWGNVLKSNVKVASEAGCKCEWGRPRLCRRDGDGDAAEPQLFPNPKGKE